MATEAGVKGMLWLRFRTPAVTKDTADNIIFAAGRSQGWKDCLDEISELLAEVEVKNQTLENP